MKPQELISQYQSLIVIGCLIMFVIIGAAFLSPQLAETITAVSQDNQASPTASERELRTGTPKHVPLKIKTKNINSEKWEHDLQIEVTNASDKPIYYLSFMLVFNGIKDDDGNEVRFWLHYGRGALNDFSTPVENTDVPIQPNEVCILKIPESDVTSWEITRTKKKYPPPTKLGLIFQVLNFGDGTGFADSGGTPVNIHKKIGSNEKCLSPPDPFTISKTDELSFIPAAFAPVNFSSKVFSKSFVRSSSPAFDCGCAGGGCNWLAPTFYTCERVCADPLEYPSSHYVGCTDPSGAVAHLPLWFACLSDCSRLVAVFQVTAARFLVRIRL